VIFWTDPERRALAVTVLDSGVGFDGESMKAFLSYGLSKAERGEGGARPAMDAGRLGVFGRGSKEASFYWAKSLCIVTRSEEGPHVWRVVVNSDDLSQRHDHDQYTVHPHSGDPGWTDPFLDPMLRVLPGLREKLSSAGQDGRTFALLCLTDIHQDQIPPITDAVFATLVRNFKQVRRSVVVMRTPLAPRPPACCTRPQSCRLLSPLADLLG
jgi:hypothetical protein